jgi:hypothetical protein
MIGVFDEDEDLAKLSFSGRWVGVLHVQYRSGAALVCRCVMQCCSVHVDGIPVLVCTPDACASVATAQSLQGDTSLGPLPSVFAALMSLALTACAVGCFLTACASQGVH